MEKEVLPDNIQQKLTDLEQAYGDVSYTKREKIKERVEDPDDVIYVNEASEEL